MNFYYPSGATPLDPDESQGLLPIHITTQSELNEWEANNIQKAENWLSSSPSHGNFLSIDFLKLVHKKMFNETWRWAGIFRSTEKNIGVPPYNITTDLTNLLENTQYRIKNSLVNEEDYNQKMDKIAYEFHHRLVFIHSFSNGNGRHARLMTDYLLIQTGCLRFTWGKNFESKKSRELYISALKKADKQDYGALAKFVRS